jgi:hypothetical protein
MDASVKLDENLLRGFVKGSKSIGQLARAVVCDPYHRFRW